MFCYYPMYGLTMAFVNYVPGREIWQCDWVGLKYFTQFVNNPVFGQLLRNTLTMSLLGITVGFIAPILFSFSLNEVGHLRTKKWIQTASYLPHFISWVVAGTMFKALLNSDGVVSDLMVSLGLFEKTHQYTEQGRMVLGHLYADQHLEGAGLVGHHLS